MEKTKSIFKNSGVILVIALSVLFFWQTEMILGFIGQSLAILSPFISAGILAFIVNVPMTAIENRVFGRFKHPIILRLKRGVSLVSTFILMIVVIGFGIFVIIPQLSATVDTLTTQITIFIPKAEQFIIELFQSNPEIIEWMNSLDNIDIMGSVINFLRTGLTSVFDTTIGVASKLVSTVTASFIAFALAIYILLQKEKLSLQFKKVIYAFMGKVKAREVVRVFSLTRKTFADFITGQCMEAVILGSLFVVVLPIFKIPFALLIGIVIGFTSIIPILGAFLGAGIGAFLIFIEDPIKAVYFLIIFLIIQQIEGNLIYPKVVGGSIGLPAMWVLAAVSIGSSLMGVAGILLFIPLTSVMYALFREVVYKKMQENNIRVADIISDSDS